MAKAAYGNIVLSIGDGASPEVFTTVAGVKSIDGPNTELAFIESTDFDSSGGFREYIAGLKDPGQLQMTLHFDPGSTGHISLLTKHDAGTLHNFKLQLLSGSPGKKWSFAAYVASVGPRLEVDGLIEAQVTLRITGSINRSAS